MLAGFIFPDLGAFLLLLIPPQNVIPEQTIRLLMLIGVIVVPGIVGLVTLALTSKDERTPRRALEAFARGYPLTILLAVLLVFLALLAIYRKVNSVIRRRTDAHVPMVVKPGAYEQVADDLDRALTDAGFDLTPETAPATMSMPAKWLAAVAGRTSSSLVPDRMLRLRGDEPRHPHLPDGHPDLGQGRRRDPSPSGDGQPADDLRRAPDGDGRGPGDRGQADDAGRRVARRGCPRADVR